jgi:hypothetical protein
MQNNLPSSSIENQTRRDLIILAVILALICCLSIGLAAGSYFFYQQYTQNQAISGTATSQYMATKIKQDTDAQATIQAQATATALVLQAQATATALALQTQATATALALQTQATATAEAHRAELMTYQYFDPFNSNTNEWRESDEENKFWQGSTRIENGVYTWQVTEIYDTFISWADFEPVESVSDFDVAVLARRQAGNPGEYCYGLLFRKSPEGFNSGNYSFSVCDNGYFAINYYNETGGWEKILDWTETSAIQPGDWNLLEISARGANFKLFINNQQVGEFNDSRLSEGTVSLYIDVYEKETGTIQFDDFALQPR